MSEDINNKEVGNRIRSIRKANGMTTDAFGGLFNPPASKGTVSKWENGRYLPNNERLVQIAKEGKITVDELLYGNKSEQYVNKLMDYISQYTKDNDMDFDEANAFFVAQKFASSYKEIDSKGMTVTVSSPPNSFDDIDKDQVITDYLSYAGNYTEEEKRLMKEISIEELRKRDEKNSLNNVEEKLLDKLELEESKEKSVDGVRHATQKDIDDLLG